MRKLIDLRARFDARVLFFKQIRTELADGTQAAQRLAAQLNPEQTELEITRAFICAEKCSEESRELIKRLNLSLSQIAEILQPYRQQLQIEDYYQSRMFNASKHAPAPAPADATNNLPTF